MIHTYIPSIQEAETKPFEDILYYTARPWGGGGFSNSGPLTVAQRLHIWVITKSGAFPSLTRKAHLSLSQVKQKRLGTLRPSTQHQGRFCNQKIIPSYFPTPSKVHQNFIYNFKVTIARRHLDQQTISGVMMRKASLSCILPRDHLWMEQRPR